MINYRVTVEHRKPAGGQDPGPSNRQMADALGKLSDHMSRYPDHDLHASGGPGSWQCSVTVTAGSPGVAACVGETLIEAIAAHTGMPPWPAVMSRSEVETS